MNEIKDIKISILLAEKEVAVEGAALFMEESDGIMSFKTKITIGEKEEDLKLVFTDISK